MILILHIRIKNVTLINDGTPPLTVKINVYIIIKQNSWHHKGAATNCSARPTIRHFPFENGKAILCL